MNEEINKINQAKAEGGETGIQKLEEIKADAEISMEGDIVRLAEEAITEIRNAGDQAKMVTASEENSVKNMGGSLDEANAKVAEVNTKIQAVEENAKQEIQAIENSTLSTEPAVVESPAPESVPAEQPVAETVAENPVPIPETQNEKSNETYSEIGQKILAGPRKILSTMSPEEVRAFSLKYPNEKAYLEDTLRELNKFSGENGGVVYENLKKYVNFLQETRGVDYSNEVLPLAEVQALRKKQDEIREESFKNQQLKEIDDLKSKQGFSEEWADDLKNRKGIENPVPVPETQNEKSAEQIELENLKLELVEKNKKHKENYDQRESVIKIIEDIKTKKGYTEELKNLNKKVIPYESVLAAVLPDKKTGLDNLQKLLSSTEDSVDKDRIQKLINKVQSIPELEVKDLTQNLSYSNYGISTTVLKGNSFDYENLGKILSNTNIDSAVHYARSSHDKVRELQAKIDQDPEIIEQQEKLLELVKQNEVAFAEVRKVEKGIEKIESKTQTQR